MLHLSCVKYYFYTQAVDIRKGFDSLRGLVQQHMQLNVLNGGIFIFINKKRNVWLRETLQRIAMHPINNIEELLPQNFNLAIRKACKINQPVACCMMYFASGIL